MAWDDVVNDNSYEHNNNPIKNVASNLYLNQAYNNSSYAARTKATDTLMQACSSSELETLILHRLDLVVQKYYFALRKNPTDLTRAIQYLPYLKAYPLADLVAPFATFADYLGSNVRSEMATDLMRAFINQYHYTCLGDLNLSKDDPYNNLFRVIYFELLPWQNFIFSTPTNLQNSSVSTQSMKGLDMMITFKVNRKETNIQLSSLLDRNLMFNQILNENELKTCNVTENTWKNKWLNKETNQEEGQEANKEIEKEKMIDDESATIDSASVAISAPDSLSAQPQSTSKYDLPHTVFADFIHNTSINQPEITKDTPTTSNLLQLWDQVSAITNERSLELYSSLDPVDYSNTALTDPIYDAYLTQLKIPFNTSYDTGFLPNPQTNLLEAQAEINKANTDKANNIDKVNNIDLFINNYKNYTHQTPISANTSDQAWYFSALNEQLLNPNTNSFFLTSSIIPDHNSVVAKWAYPTDSSFETTTIPYFTKAAKRYHKDEHVLDERNKDDWFDESNYYDPTRALSPYNPNNYHNYKINDVSYSDLLRSFSNPALARAYLNGLDPRLWVDDSFIDQTKSIKNQTRIYYDDINQIYIKQILYHDQDKNLIYRKFMLFDIDGQLWHEFYDHFYVDEKNQYLPMPKQWQQKKQM